MKSPACSLLGAVLHALLVLPLWQPLFSALVEKHTYDVMRSRCLGIVPCTCLLLFVWSSQQMMKESWSLIHPTRFLFVMFQILVLSQFPLVELMHGHFSGVTERHGGRSSADWGR